MHFLNSTVAIDAYIYLYTLHDREAIKSVNLLTWGNTNYHHLDSPLPFTRLHSHVHGLEVWRIQRATE